SVQQYRKAAQQGHAVGQYTLAKCYQFGEGVAQDWAMAARLFTQAAKQGYANAQNELAFCNSRGEGAACLYALAAAQLHCFALARLGICFEKGRGVEKSGDEAAACFAKVCDIG
ncbi:hypothetical protein T492DRAFT_561676, partial [Pavlovales sp. CCMP2436]